VSTMALAISLWLIGVTDGSFLSMISSAAHSRWPLWHPSWIWFRRLSDKTPRLTDPIFLVAYWVWLEAGSFGWQVLPLIHHGRHSTHLGFHFRPLFHKRLSRRVWFFLPYWGRLQEGSFRWQVPPLIQGGHAREPSSVDWLYLHLIRIHDIYHTTQLQLCHFT
jgi:hypothetical protein